MKNRLIFANFALITQCFGSSDLLTPVRITIQIAAGASIERIAKDLHLSKVEPRRIEGFYVAQPAGDAQMAIKELNHRNDVILAYIDKTVRLVKAN